MQTEERHWYADGLDPEELAFQRLYGPWRPASPEQAREVFAGYAGDWWIAGGWAIEAFTGVPRPHEDIDVSLWRRDVEKLRVHLKGRYHLWSNDGGRLLPLTDERPEQPESADQIWLRRHALAPWEFDLVLNPDRDGRWVFRRDPSLDYALDEITWVAPDGLRYVTPEMALAYKARLARPKDEQDLAACLPLLTTARRTWLGDMVDRLHPGHRWLERIRAA
ncbi:conserved hypothetical protein [Kribbella flavida DSM 17836]|uniref:Aminoglycoside-2''-adenylyltransferase n=1 Tax=Kribbella flavida (strain DSM 17836 / JCM 10339 / NBRC 14399) TaxID=479435 RepID=D2Q1Y0_KRIFD|nr:hypothetical protein [Kribbella flavida]ADB33926.1 conserved hypothetical protein [Kribbella flavida DSM 17836]